MRGRIDLVLAAGEYGDRAGLRAGPMRCGIDAARQPRNNGEAGLHETLRQNLRDLDAGGRRIARADNGDPGAKRNWAS